MPNVNAVVINDRGPRSLAPFSSATNGSDLANLRLMKTHMVDLSVVDANGYVFAWQNPEANIIIIREVIINVITGSTAAATLNVDVVNDATSNGNTIILNFALDATGMMSSHPIGSGGNEKPHYMNAFGSGTNAFLTGYESAAQATDGIVGRAYIIYTEVP